MKYLIVVAHPDDEVLGAGASIYKWTHKGDTVDVAIMIWMNQPHSLVSGKNSRRHSLTLK